jgi:hypothetical protein
MSTAGGRDPDAIPPSTFAGFFRASEMNTMRSMILYAVGALVGLGIAGYGLFTAAGTSTRTVPPEDVALVNQRPILRSDFINQLESETGLKFDETTQADRLKVLDEMVREELLVQRGLELDFAETDQTTRNALVSTISQQATVEVTTSQPTEQQLRDFYEQHKSQYATDGMMQVHNLVLPAAAPPAAAKSAGTAGSAPAAAGKPASAAPSGDPMQLAARAADDLRGGVPMDQVMTKYGLIEAQRYDEDYYFAAKYRLGDALFDSIKDLGAGQVSAPLRLKDGVHIVMMLSNKKPVPLGYDASRKQVYGDYNDAAQARLLDATMKFLRTRSKILIAPDYSGVYKP